MDKNTRKNIVLNADKEILLQGKRVTLGNADGSTDKQKF